MVHGVLLINKEAGGTSHDVVSAVRRILGQKKVGHAGTLDPLAEGLIVVLLGYGVKLSNCLLINDKKYHFTLRLGVTTDTLDKTGKIVEKKEVLASEEQITQIMQKSQGQLSLPVPLVSAVKVKGKKLYEYQRANQDVTVPLRDMVFRDLEIKNVKKETVEVILSCSKGSYVRSWVSFVGEELGTGACLENLTRLESFPFKVSSALTLREVEERIEKSLYGSNLKNAHLTTPVSTDNATDKLASNPADNATDNPVDNLADNATDNLADNPVDNNEAVKIKDKDTKPTNILSTEQLCEILGSAFIPFSQALSHVQSIRAEIRDDETQLRYGKISSNLKTRLLEEQKTVNKNRKSHAIRVMSRNNRKMLALLELKPFVSPKLLRVFPDELF